MPIYNNTRTFSVNYVDIAGDLATGIMLSQIVAWFQAGESSNGRFEKTSADWWEACRVLPQQASRCLNTLEDKGIISIIKRAKLSDGSYYQSFIFHDTIRLRELMELLQKEE